MATFYCKFFCLLFIQCCFATHTLSDAANAPKALKNQCNNWFHGRSTETLASSRFSNGCPALVLHTLLVITTKNKEHFNFLHEISTASQVLNSFRQVYDLEKVKLGDDWTNLYVECRAAYPLAMEINKGDSRIVHQRFRWKEPAFSAHLEFFYVVATILQFNSSETEITLNVTCTDLSLNHSLSQFISNFEFSYYRDKWGRYLLSHSVAQIERNNWVDLGSKQDIKRVCMPMRLRKANADEYYKHTDHSKEKGHYWKVLCAAVGGTLIFFLGIVICKICSENSKSC